MLSGTEVFHRRCAYGIANSRSTRLELEINRLASELAGKNAEVQKMRQLLGDAEVSRRRAVETAADARDSATYWKTQADLTRSQLDLARVERDAVMAEQEAALAERRRAVEGAARAPAPTPESPASDLDDTALRFSLLELDKP